MRYADPRPVLARIARLEERLKEEPKSRFALFKDSAKVISVAAFIISIITTIYAWRKDDLQSRESARRQFDSTMQHLIEIGFKNYEFTARNKDEPNFGAIAGWFAAQSSLMGNRAFQQLAAIDDASMFDYILVGNTMAQTGQPSRASILFQKAIEIGEQKTREERHLFHGVLHKAATMLFGERLDVSVTEEQRIADLAIAYKSWGQSLYSENKTGDAVKAYAKAIQIYKDSNQREDVKNNAFASIYKSWAEAVANADCNLSLKYLQTADDFLPNDRRFRENFDWRSIQDEKSWISSHCGGDGKLRGDTPAQMIGRAFLYSYGSR